MKRRLAIITEIISPYRIPLFNALAREAGVDLRVVFLSETDQSLRQWKVYKDEIQFSYKVLPYWRRRIGKYNALLNWGLRRELQTFIPDVIICGGYSYVASWHALRWARLHQVPFLLWSESNSEDRRRNHGFVESLKRRFLASCSGFVVPGKAAGQYLEKLGVSPGAIYFAPNAVDNALFARGVSEALEHARETHQKLDLPERYFVYVGRLVEEKGVFDLLRAYAGLDTSVRERLGLVYVGDGPCRRELEIEAKDVTSGVVKFSGFAQREQLPAYYALAEALVLPTYTDTWGLVVNEAMACGLPVILSRVAGCGADLVREHWNGLLVAPRDVGGLTRAMEIIATQPDLVRTMRSRSAELIRGYSPEAWSAGILGAVSHVVGTVSEASSVPS